jgi:hypothetical protein
LADIKENEDITNNYGHYVKAEKTMENTTCHMLKSLIEGTKRKVQKMAG